MLIPYLTIYALLGTAQHITEGVDNIGPDDPLPRSVSSKSSFESRTQVTW